MEENDNIEDEMEKLDEEIEETSTKSPTKKQSDKIAKEKPEITERYTAFYQEARIGIVDTITNEVIVEGLPNVTTATLEAVKLNKLNKIEIASGV